MRTPQPGPMKLVCAIVLPPVVVTQKRVQGKSTSEKNKFAQKRMVRSSFRTLLGAGSEGGGAGGSAGGGGIDAGPPPKSASTANNTSHREKRQHAPAAKPIVGSS